MFRTNRLTSRLCKGDPTPGCRLLVNRPVFEGGEGPGRVTVPWVVSAGQCERGLQLATGRDGLTRLRTGAAAVVDDRH